jgi:hypothetical protein
MSRGEVAGVIAKGVDSLNKLLEVSVRVLEGPLVPTRAKRLLDAAHEYLEDASLRCRNQQVRRLEEQDIDPAALKAIYTDEGRDLEKSIDAILKEPFCKLKCVRIVDQRQGEPDHVLYGPNGEVLVIQTTAAEKSLIGIKKTMEIVGQSASYKPTGYIVVGRPDFHSDAIKGALDHVGTGKNFKLIPVMVLGEMYVLFREGKLKAETVADILLRETGHLTLQRIAAYALGNK